jgi:hypothetical protein
MAWRPVSEHRLAALDHGDHVALLRRPWRPAAAGSTWCRRRSVHVALADLLGPGGRIVAADRDRGAPRGTPGGARAPGVRLTTQVADFASADLPQLDGLVAANSLHFVAELSGRGRRLAAYLRPGGRFVVVEYDADRGNPWVPHPFSYPSWERLAGAAGLVDTRRIGRVPSRFLGAIYAAESRRP